MVGCGIWLELKVCCIGVVFEDGGFEMCYYYFVDIICVVEVFLLVSLFDGVLM